MSNPGHADLGPELRKLAQAILDRLDPAVRAAAAMAGESMRGPGRCQQVWCPVCALAALVSGEQHPLLNVIAEHSVGLMSMIQTLIADRPGDAETAAPEMSDDEPDDPPDGDAPPPSSSVRFHQIPIVVEFDSLDPDPDPDADADADADEDTSRL